MVYPFTYLYISLWVLTKGEYYTHIHLYFS